MANTPSQTLSPKEVAQQLGLCSKSVLKLINKGSIHPVYRINKRVIRISQQAVDDYLKACSDPSKYPESSEY
jgi:excisionase family DNA binding protein